MVESVTFRGVRDRLRSPGTSTVLVGSALSGLGAYAFQVIGTRTLGSEGYAPISVLWTIQYLAMTVALVSVEAYLTRAIVSHPDQAQRIRRATVALGGWVLAVTGAVGVGAWIWRAALFHGAGDDLPLVAALTVLGYGMFVLVRGELAGRNRFATYGVATGAESVVRVAVALPVAVVFATARSLAWTLPTGAMSVAGWWLLWGRANRATRETTPAVEAAAPLPLPTGSTGGYLLATTTANAAAQTLLAAGPLVLVPLGAPPAEISVFFITITAARVPLVFAFGGVLSRVLPTLTRAARGGQIRRLRRLGAGVCAAAVALSLVGAALGAWLGPEVIAVLFGAALTPPGWFVALTVAGVILATAGLAINQILVAMEAELRLVAPWLLGLTVGAAGVMLSHGSPTFRVALGFVAGEAAALAGLLVTLTTTRRTAHGQETQ